ncbi:hypothetical protein TNCV_3149611 [Trichonephila clavipes]|nr:hypothetical protein TNCV_3149611 [Trichonephila clavipes]
MTTSQRRFKLISGCGRRRSTGPLDIGGSKFITRKSGFQLIRALSSPWPLGDSPKLPMDKPALLQVAWKSPDDTVMCRIDASVRGGYIRNTGKEVKLLVSRLSLQSDFRRTFIWRVPGTRYHQENIIERHRFGGTGLLVWEKGNYSEFQN